MNQIPDSPSALLAAIDAVLTVDRPAFADFARSLSALVVCRAEYPPDPHDPDSLDFCDAEACGCGGPALPVTVRLLNGLGVDVEKSLAALNGELGMLSSIDTKAAVGDPYACDCTLVACFVDSYLENPEAWWRCRQEMARHRTLDIFFRWQRYLGEAKP